MRLLLDTCTFLWLANASEPLPSEVLQAITMAESEVLVSSVTPWELSIKAARHGARALETESSVDALVTGAMSGYRLTALPISFEHGLRAGMLPMHHRDPFDRMLIAQALAEDIPIATPDPAFAPYGVKLLWR